MSPRCFAVLLSIHFASLLLCRQPIAFGQQPVADITAKPNDSVGFATSTPPSAADRPLTPSPSGGNVITPIPIPNSAPLIYPNQYQQAAQIAQANRNTSYFTTRSVNAPYNPAYQGNQGVPMPWLSQAPPAYYPNSNQAPYYAANPMVAAAGPQMPNASTAQPVSNTVIPMVPMQPNANTMASVNGTANVNGTGGTGNPYYPGVPNPNYPSPNPYQYTNSASRPLFKWPSFVSAKGSLFSKSPFSVNRNTNYDASNTTVTQPYLWGNNPQSGQGLAPNTSPNPTSQPSWGVAPGGTSRDSMQGGMPATVIQ